MTRQFRLIDRWEVPLSPDEVFTLLAHARHYDEWWARDAMRCVSADPGAPMVGRAATLSVRGFLPYRLTVTTTSTVLERPSRIVGDSTGDLVGTGDWTIIPRGHGSIAVLDWRVSVAGRVEGRVAPLLRPLLAANHRWTMRRGEEGMALNGRRIIERHGLVAPGQVRAPV